MSRGPASHVLQLASSALDNIDHISHFAGSHCSYVEGAAGSNTSEKFPLFRRFHRYSNENGHTCCFLAFGGCLWF